MIQHQRERKRGTCRCKIWNWTGKKCLNNRKMQRENVGLQVHGKSTMTCYNLQVRPQTKLARVYARQFTPRTDLILGNSISYKNEGLNGSSVMVQTNFGNGFPTFYLVVLIVSDSISIIQIKRRGGEKCVRKILIRPCVANHWQGILN